MTSRTRAPAKRPKKRGKGWRIFTSPPAFIIQIIVLSVLVAVIGAITLTLIGALTLFTMIPMLIIGCVYLGVSAIYLTGTRRWHQFIGFWMELRDQLSDKILSVRTSHRVLRQRYGRDSERGLFLSMAPATRFPKRRPSKLVYHDDRHVFMIGGTRAGKDRSVILPNLAHWKGSVILYDPAGEGVALSAAYRQRELDQRVLIIDPFGVTPHGSECFNPLAELSDDDPFLVEKVQLMAESLIENTGGDNYWPEGGRELLSMLILHVVTRSIPEQCHLMMVRKLLMSSDLDPLWVSMSRNDALGGIIGEFGEANQSRDKRELASMVQTVRVNLKWLNATRMRDLIKTSSFSLADLKREKVTLYLVLPPGRGESFRLWLKLMFNMAFDAMQDTSIPKPEESVLFLLNEFPLMGRMERIEQAAGEAAKFGIKLFLCCQDINQMKKHYGEHWETFIANSGLLIAFGNHDLATQSYISARLGKEYYRKMSFTSGASAGPGTSSSSHSTTSSWELRDVARPEEIDKSVARQSGEAYFFIAGEKPIQIARANHDAWAMLETHKPFIPSKTAMPIGVDTDHTAEQPVPDAAMAAE